MARRNLGTRLRSAGRVSWTLHYCCCFYHVDICLFASMMKIEF